MKLMNSAFAGPPHHPLHSHFRDSYLGRIAAGRVVSGTLRVGDKIRVLQKLRASEGGKASSASDSDDLPPLPLETKVTKVFKRVGMERVPVEEAVAGDIVAIAGSEAGITDTLAGPGVDVALDPGHIDPPTLRCGVRHVHRLASSGSLTAL